MEEGRRAEGEKGEKMMKWKTESERWPEERGRRTGQMAVRASSPPFSPLASLGPLHPNFSLPAAASPRSLWAVLWCSEQAGMHA